MEFEKAKIALVFDWTTTPGGAEKVNYLLHQIFPEAPIFTSVYNKEKLPQFSKAKIHTSFIQKLPFAKTKHQFYLSLMPQAYESFDLSDYDIVISSSHACAKGIITKPETLHVCYCHTPMRYAWDKWHSYIQGYRMNPILKKLGKRRIHKIRMWDRVSADRVDYYLANSNTTKRRIHKYYDKQSTILHPSINTNEYQASKKTKGYFLAAGRLIPYKKFDLIIETFNEIGLPLKIAGTGNDEYRLQKMANHNIEFLGYIPDEELKQLYSECEAFIFPQLEDFGITPLEAMASGRPVIAFEEGGALDTITDKTGIFFKEQTSNSLKKAINKYLENPQQFKSEEIQKHAAQFDDKQFERKLLKYLRDKWNSHSERLQSS